MRELIKLLKIYKGELPIVSIVLGAAVFSFFRCILIGG